MNYRIQRRCIENIADFYHHVSLKYRHTYSVELMHQNLDEALDAISP